MALFKNKFNFVLEAKDDVEDAPVGPATDKEAMAGALDTATPQDFDVSAPGRQPVEDVHTGEQVGLLQQWIGQIDQFIEYLNGTSPDSIQTKLHAAPCDTIFEDIARSEKKKISRLAAELSSLSESLKGYLISANDR